MKNKLLLVAIIAAGLSTGVKAEVIDWAQGADLTTVDSVATTLGWTIELYQAVDARQAGWESAVLLNADGTVALSSGLGTANDLFLSGVGTVLAEPYGPGYVAPPLGESAVVASAGNYYGILFNAASIAAATDFVVLDMTPVNVKNGDGTVGPNATYAVGLSGAGSWQAIPEPATLGLMGIAGLGMFLARKKARR